jgi:hypothetical protein
MRLNKTTYFSFFFLFCFLASFSVNTFQSLNSQSAKAGLLKKEAVSFSKKDQGTDTKTDLLLEENENENEDGFNLPAFILPFSLSFLQLRAVIQNPVSTKPLAETITNPIYITVCNFRI